MDNLEAYMTYVSEHWSEVAQSNESLSIPQVQNILLKNWKKIQTLADISKKEKAQKTVPFFQENFKNPYFSTFDRDTATVMVSDKAGMDSDHNKLPGLDSDKVVSMENVQGTSVQSETMSGYDDIQEEEEEKTRMSPEDIDQLIRPSMRKSIAKKNEKYTRFKSVKKKTDPIKSVKIVTDKTENVGKQVPDLVELEGEKRSFQAPKPKSWTPPFNPVCWKLGCKFCEAQKCGVCVNCVKKKRCVLRVCPRISKKDVAPPENINSLPKEIVIIEESPKEKPKAGSDQVVEENNNSKKQDEDISQFKCIKCGKLFQYLKSLNNHKCTEKSKSCPSCSKVISNANFAKHIKMHSAPKFKCLKCNKHFLSEKKRDTHMKTHTEYTCNFCSKKFENPAKLKRHVTSHGMKEQSGSTSKPQVKIVKCNVCKAELASKRVLGIHLQNVHKEIALRCDICDKPFFTKNGLKKHKRNHKRSDLVEQEVEINSTNNDAEKCANLDLGEYVQIDETNSDGSLFVALQNDTGIEVLQNVIFVNTAESGKDATTVDLDKSCSNNQIELNFEDY